MAFGRVRNNKRSSSNSYASTITTVFFIAVCVLGVWLLTSDSGVTPQSTTRTSTTPNESDDITKPDASTTATKQDDKTITRQFQNNPGDLPDDALKNDEGRKSSQDQKLDQASTKDYSQEANVGASYQVRKDDVQEKERENVGDGGKGKENEPQVDGDAQRLGGKDSVEEHEKQTQVSEESTLTQQQTIKDSTTDKITNLDAQRNDLGNDQESNKPQYQTEESKNDHPSSKDEKQKEENQQQPMTEEQQREQLQEDQGQDEKTVTFSDETKKDQTTQPQDIKEEANTRLEKDVTNQQDKKAIAKQVDSQQERDSTTQVNKQDADETTQPQDVKEETNTRLEKDDTNQQDKQMSQQQDKEATKEQVDSQQKSDSTTQGNKQDASATGDKPMDSNLLPNSGIPKESNESKSSWSTQASESRSEKQRHKDKVEGQDEENLYGYTWKLCNVTTSQDYIPCLDNEKVVKQLRSIKHFEHRERHCPEDPPTCLVPTPQGYKKPIQWPHSRNKIWFHNVPHTELVKVKGHQNWVKVSGKLLTFPGGGTQFMHGALHYIDFLEKTAPEIKWGKHTRVVLDVGCGVASFGGYLFDKDVLTMSFAPKDEHEAQVQFALERGIPAISAVMGSQRLPFPSGVFDVVHCARCRVPWHAEGGRLLLELNRVLRSGGFFVWSATPVYQKLQQDVDIWEGMVSKLELSILS